MRNTWNLLAPLFLLLSFSSWSQDFSNKGRDFWVGYGLHCRMFQNVTGGNQEMVLYFATEAVTNVTVSIPAIGYSITYNNIPANTIFTTNPLPKTGTNDARLTSEGISGKGIHVTADRPIVAYAHIYSGNVSGATLLFPTTTLGKEYYSLNAEQHSNESNSNSFFYVVAADTGTTTIEVTPSAQTQTMNANTTYTFNLTQGQVLNVLGVITGNDGIDLTGSRIKSISAGTGGCKRIAVFSGSGKINMKCPQGPSGNSADNFMVQAFPKNAWGKYYLTAPTSQMPNNFFRIAVSDPSTIVKLNGTILTNLVNNFYYEVGPSATPNLIEADKPIMVAQYITSANQCGNTSIGGNGDPEVIYLSPVEQNINKVILNSTPNFAILPQQHYLNVVIANTGTAISSFRIDGLPPSSPFLPHPQNPNFAYLVQNVSQGQHIIQSDSGFNAIAYGYGGAESYGYNAGANVKDLYQFISINNQYATVDFPATCRNSPFYFSAVFPYQPAQIKWMFNGLFPDVMLNAPVADSSWIVNGRILYRYKIPAPYSISATGTYQIRIIAQNPTPEGCSGEQEVVYDLQVYERPVADFTFQSTGCLSDTVSFLDNANPNGRTISQYQWNFGDGNSSGIKNPVHLFQNAGTYPVKFAVITDIGCLSDTITKMIEISQEPTANFTFGSPVCFGQVTSFVDGSIPNTGNIIKWTWTMGDGTTLNHTTSAPVDHLYAATGSYQVTLTTETDKGCSSQPFSQTIFVHPKPEPGFIVPANCLADPFSPFFDTSSIADGSENLFTYLWNFGDPNANAGNPNSSNIKNPTHHYTATGSYTVSLTVTSNNGCVANTSQQFMLNGTVPHSQFLVNGGANHCSNKMVSILNQSTVDIGNLVKLEIFWDDLNDPSNKTTVAYPLPGAVFTHAYPEFYAPASKIYTIRVVAYSGDNCLHSSSQSITVHAIPEVIFEDMPGVCLDVLPFQINAASVSNLNGNPVFSGSGVNATGIFNPQSAGSGDHLINYTFHSDNGCMNSESKMLTVFTLPEVNAGPDLYVLEGGSALIAATANGNGLTYIWSPGTALNNTEILQPTITPTNEMNYQILVTSADGCKSSDEVLVRVLKMPIIPNTFSPNGDGIHDRWEIRYLESYPGATVEIFNRYGQQVFRSIGYPVPWDGKYKGADLPAGTYYYIIQPKNGRKQIAGFVDIIR